MPFEAGLGAPKKMAVIGVEISGMGAAHALAENPLIGIEISCACPR